MPNKTNTSSSRVGKQPSKGGFKFRWWMGVALVAVVAIVGVLVLRYSRASSYVVFDVSVASATDTGIWNVTQHYQGAGYSGSLSRNILGSAPNAGQIVWRMTTGGKLLTVCGTLQTTNFKTISAADLAPGMYKFVVDKSCADIGKG